MLRKSYVSPSCYCYVTFGLPLDALVDILDCHSHLLGRTISHSLENTRTLGDSASILSQSLVRERHETLAVGGFPRKTNECVARWAPV